MEFGVTVYPWWKPARSLLSDLPGSVEPKKGLVAMATVDVTLAKIKGQHISHARDK